MKNFIKENWFRLGFLILVFFLIVIITYGSYINSNKPSTIISESNPVSETITPKQDLNTEPVKETAQEASTPQQYKKITYTVMCVGAVTTFVECKPILATEQQFQIMPETGIVRVYHPDLPSATLIQRNCLITNSNNWVCTDPEGYKTGYAGGQYFNDAQDEAMTNQNRVVTGLTITKDQYEAVSFLLKMQAQSQ